ncbi:MAG: metal-sulfur cluster assembly factor [Anaerolineae bacterium]|nr:metal-sulfur cluster assembly factor [Anaerolineae bacterium]
MNNSFQMLLSEELVYAALKEVIDPELGLNIVDLGLIYGLAINAGAVAVTMTLTTPGCPMHASFRQEIEATLWRALPGLESVAVELVWDPPWTPEMLTPAGRAELGLF